MAGLGSASVTIALLGALAMLGSEASAQVGLRNAAPVPGGDGLLIDPENGCGTSNPIPRLGETIRWQGGCRDGLLDGQGTLMWFQDGKIREKNEGAFAEGELEGQATTTFADGSMIIGNYSRGVRHGEFIIRRAIGSNIRALYAQGKLVSERELSDEELRSFRDGKYRPAPIEAASAAAAAAPVTQTAQPPLPVVPSSARPQANPAFAPAPAAPAVTQGDIIVPWSPRAYGNTGATGVMVAGMPTPLPAAPAPIVPAQAAAMPAMQTMPTMQAAPVTTPRVGMLGGPDQALNEAMLLERAGRNDEAAQLYAEIASVTGATPTGLLAAERAAKLRAPGDRPVAYQNAPLALPGTTILANAAQRVPLNGKFVCSARDIFDNNANWCGRALREEGNDVEVEIRSLKFNRLFAVGFSAAPCTGGRFLGPFAEGTKIWVARGCLEGNP